MLNYKLLDIARNARLMSRDRGPSILRASAVFAVLFATLVMIETATGLPNDMRPDTDEWSVFIHTRRGEKQERRTRIWIVGIGEQLFIRTGSTRWHDDVKLDPNVSIEHSKGGYASTAVIISDPAEHARVMQAYREKYGWMDWIIYRTRGRTLRLDPPVRKTDSSTVDASPIHPQESAH